MAQFIPDRESSTLEDKVTAPRAQHRSMRIAQLRVLALVPWRITDTAAIKRDSRKSRFETARTPAAALAPVRALFAKQNILHDFCEHPVLNRWPGP